MTVRNSRCLAARPVPLMWAMKHVTDVQVRPTPMWPTGTTVIEPTVDPSRVSESCLFKPVLSAVMGAFTCAREPPHRPDQQH